MMGHQYAAGIRQCIKGLTRFVAVLVFILAVTQAAIRQNTDSLAFEDTLTLAELRASVSALKDVDLSIKPSTQKRP